PRKQRPDVTPLGAGEQQPLPAAIEAPRPDFVPLAANGPVDQAPPFRRDIERPGVGITWRELYAFVATPPALHIQVERPDARPLCRQAEGEPGIVGRGRDVGILPGPDREPFGNATPATCGGIDGHAPDVPHAARYAFEVEHAFGSRPGEPLEAQQAAVEQVPRFRQKRPLLGRFGLGRSRQELPAAVAPLAPDRQLPAGRTPRRVT